jgi:hypothetical protein
VKDVVRRQSRENDPEVETVVPLLLGVHEVHPRPGKMPPATLESHYYFWVFGYVAKMPYERNVDVIPIIPLDSPLGVSKHIVR